MLVLSEPTRGMDVGAKDDVVKIVRGLRDQGIGIVVVSTEPETVLSLADRILVMKKGRIVREFAGETVSKDRLLEARDMSSEWPGRAACSNQMRNIAPFADPDRPGRVLQRGQPVLRLARQSPPIS